MVGCGESDGWVYGGCMGVGVMFGMRFWFNSFLAATSRQLRQMKQGYESQLYRVVFEYLAGVL